MFDFFHSIDRALFTEINHSPFSSLDPLMRFLSSPTLWIVVGVILTLISVLVFFMGEKKWLKGALLALIALGLSDLTAGHFLKPFFQRVRPCHQEVGARTVSECGGRFSLPSNHASNGMAIATVLAFFLTAGWRALALVLAVLVGYSRVHLGVHFPGDVLFGFLLGALIGTLVVFATKLGIIFRNTPILVSFFKWKSVNRNPPRGTKTRKLST